MHLVRKPAVAGTFYPGQGQPLADEVARMLANATKPASEQTASPKAFIVPHAGYVYSGTTAASAYALLGPMAHTIERVVLLGPVHRVPVRGLAVPGVDAFSTPLGEIEVDAEAIAALAHLPQVVVSQQAHTWEHSLEVQLPFLQTILPRFKLAPLAVGDATSDEVAQVLTALWGGPETLLVISSDLSHFLPYAAAQKTDQNTVDLILRLDGHLTHTQACGATPINGLLLAARAHHLQPRLLAQCNSGDSAGDRQRVVGYAAFAFGENDHEVH
jgi:AmmeMemoRadiSam system protein B